MSHTTDEPPPPPEDKYFFFFSHKCGDCKKFYDQLPELPSEILDNMEGYDISTGNYPPELRLVPSIMTQIYFHDEGRYKTELLQGPDAFIWFNQAVVVGNDHDGGGKIPFSFIQDAQKLSKIDSKASVFLDEKQYRNQQMRLTPEQLDNLLLQPYNIVNPKNLTVESGINNIPQKRTVHTGNNMPDIVPQGQKLPSINISKAHSKDLDKKLNSLLTGRESMSYHQKQQRQPVYRNGTMPQNLQPVKTRIDHSSEFDKEVERAISERGQLLQTNCGFQNREALKPERVDSYGDKERELNLQIQKKMQERNTSLENALPNMPHHRRRPPVHRVQPPQQRRYPSTPKYSYGQQQNSNTYIPPHRRSF